MKTNIEILSELIGCEINDRMKKTVSITIEGVLEAMDKIRPHDFIAKEITENDIFKSLDFSNLKRGDIVQNLGSGISYVITSVRKGEAIAIRQIEITNKNEWRVLK